MNALRLLVVVLASVDGLRVPSSMSRRSAALGFCAAFAPALVPKAAVADASIANRVSMLVAETSEVPLANAIASNLVSSVVEEKQLVMAIAAFTGVALMPIDQPKSATVKPTSSDEPVDEFRAMADDRVELVRKGVWK
jgi:hypothetical protein